MYDLRMDNIHVDWVGVRVWVRTMGLTSLVVLVGLIGKG